MQRKLLYGAIAMSAMLTLSACGKNPTPTGEQVKEAVNVVQEKAAEVKEGGQKITGNIKDVMHLGTAMKCTWNDGNGMEGITYVDGDKVNSKVVNMPAGENGTLGDAYTISDGEWLYMWTSLSANGTKMKIDPTMMDQKATENDTLGDKAPSSGASQGMDMSAQYDYDCTKWSPDASLFVPPANITFSDMSAMLQQMNGTGGGGDLKQMCAMLSGQDKIDCEAQFK